MIRPSKTLLLLSLICFWQFASAQCYEVGELVWSDEFDYTGLPDPLKWGYDVGGGGWGNQEDQYYTENRTENARVENGELIIEARKESFGGKDYTSARLVSRDKGDWLYGRIEVKAKIPVDQGTWPAIWMLPTDWEYGGWPKSGEIDIMENFTAWNINRTGVRANIHTEDYNHTKGTNKGDDIESLSDISNNFHVYAVTWNPDYMEFDVDGETYFRFQNEGTWETWPFDKRFHLILNIAIGGAGGGTVDDNLFPHQMVVDYVRVYDIEEVGDQSPFGSERIAIPGILQVENYDEGCFGASYVDADAENQGGDFRLEEGVDIQSTTDIGGGYNVGWTDVGEWTEYSVTVATTGEYAVTARLASGDGDGGAFHLEIDGQNISGNIGTGNTGDWQSWVDVSVDGVELSAGDHIIRLVVDNNAVNINYLDFDFLTSTDKVIQ